jgi:hypothetical protein
VHDLSALAAVGRLPVENDGRPVFAVVGTKLWEPGHPLTSGRADAPGVVEGVAALPCALDSLVAEASGLGEAVAGRNGLLWRALRQRPPWAGGMRRSSGVRVISEWEWDEEAELRRARWQEQRRRAGHFSTSMVGLHVTAESKVAMYGALAFLVGRQQLLFRAADEELRRQLLTLRVDLSPAGHERIRAPRDESGHSDLASALALCMLPVKARDGWRSRLVELADRRLPRPEGLPPPGQTVRAGGGLEVPTRPAVVSVAGRGVTVPGRPYEPLDLEAEIPIARRPGPYDRPRGENVTAVDLPLRPRPERTLYG